MLTVWPDLLHTGGVAALVPALLLAMALALVFASALVVALWIDQRWGEPPTLIHPVVWMGNYLQVIGKITVRYPPARAFVLGTLAWLLGAVVTGAIAWGAQMLALEFILRLVPYIVQHAWPTVEDAGAAALTFALLGCLLKCMLSWRMLSRETAAVETALQKSLDAGRERLSWLVSRDTAQLSESEVRESAIESLSENLNDSVVAPIFWFVLLGLPGAAVYRFANTADAMWGYRGTYQGQHWEWAGKWAAHADDVLSWLPARVTALLIKLVAPGVLLKSLQQEAQKPPSPNSGWPMAAMALALGVSLRKPGVYTLNPGGRLPGPQDMAAAQKYASKVLVAYINIALVAITLIAIVSIYLLPK